MAPSCSPENSRAVSWNGPSSVPKSGKITCHDAMSVSKNKARMAASALASVNKPAPLSDAERIPAPASNSRQRPALSRVVMSTVWALRAIRNKEGKRSTQQKSARLEALGDAQHAKNKENDYHKTDKVNNTTHGSLQKVIFLTRCPDLTAPYKIIKSQSVIWFRRKTIFIIKSDPRGQKFPRMGVLCPPCLMPMTFNLIIYSSE